MKKLLYLSFLALVSVFFIQCDSEDDLMTENALEGGLVDISSTSINYVIGSGASYTFDLFIHQEGDVKINTVNLYKSCFYAAAIPWYDPADTTHATADSVAAKYTDEILEHTINITETSVSHEVATLDWFWEDLREGLTQEDGNELPLLEGAMEIGNYFQFVVEVELSDGRTLIQSSPVKMAVSTRYAGTYNITQGDYIHPDFLSSYAGEIQRQIESVDAVTYKMIEIGPWNDQGNYFYFVVNPDNTITIPKEYGGETQLIWGADELANCVDDPGELPDCSCVNLVTVVDSGADIIQISYGYIRTSGTRQFDETLVKDI
ncbi:MAG: hypothetical protein PF485_04745 [Bacteroidales bacterium]|jgi:hypothetical protein|nr:hypothetical protein [Bacteroidales bacterium]